MGRYYGNYVEGVSKQKLYKHGYEFFTSYWTDKVSQQDMLIKLFKGFDLIDYKYTQRRDDTGLFKVVIFVKREKVND